MTNIKKVKVTSINEKYENGSFIDVDYSVPMLDEQPDYDSSDWKLWTNQNVNLGTSSWGHNYRFNLREVYGYTPLELCRTHWKHRVFKRKQLIEMYLTHSAVREWCNKIELDLFDIRDMRSTTDFYDEVILPEAMQLLLDYRNESSKKRNEMLENGLYHFAKFLITAIMLTEETDLFGNSKKEKKPNQLELEEA